METIPTAIEWLKPHVHHSQLKELEDCMLKFAKLHVQAALKKASEKAIAKENPRDYGTGEIWVDKESILNAYSLNNIK